ncbi:MAG: hypothetical protein A2Z38_00185 [Planctomycetes bacterium RBG_19FT_COMBO_48_8]|nr:MAG: hypothetical protein A2Z38_00185 [Planctomycetes bacterium RBG_19FT_COMBO_48_8]
MRINSKKVGDYFALILHKFFGFNALCQRHIFCILLSLPGRIGLRWEATWRKLWEKTMDSHLFIYDLRFTICDLLLIIFFFVHQRSSAVGLFFKIEYRELY